MNMDKVIPRIQFDIDADDPNMGVKVLSLVDEPAIESNFVFFSKEKKKFIELKGEKFKQIVAGLALIPEKDILRYDAAGEPYYGVFGAEVIEKIRTKFHKELLTNRVNTDHSSTNYIDAFLIESFIIDSAERLADVKAKGIEEAVEGSWYVAYKIDDPETFKRVVSGELRGFSVEVFLTELYKHNNSKVNELENVMNKFLQKFKELLSEMEAGEKVENATPELRPEIKLEQGKTSDGATVEYGAVGEPVNILDASGAASPAPDGDYTLDNGKVITVASGVATEIKEAEEAPVEQAVAPTPDFSKELESIKSELAKTKDELKKSNEEIQKLKKTPLANPVTKAEVKTEQVDVSKLSNIEKLRLKYKINNN